MIEPSSPLVISQTDQGLRIAGEIDAHTAPSVAEAIMASNRSELSIDMSAVEFVDSSGLRVLIEAHQQLVANGGALHLVDASAVVRRLLEISGVVDYLPLD